jgi:hypothetical protein
MRVANGLYLDNKNQFHTGPLPNAPVYEIGGGQLSLTAQTTNGLINGTLSILPLADQPGWKSFLRDKGVEEAAIELFGKVADVAAVAVTIVGMLPVAIKLVQMLGIIKADKTAEQLAQEILLELGVVQDMIADVQGSIVRTALDSSVGIVGGLRDQVENTMKLMVNLDVVGRKASRASMLDKVDQLDNQVRQILQDSRWKLVNQAKQYRGSWSFMTDTQPSELHNPPWWGAPRFVPRVRLSDNGHTWVPATYPPAYTPPRFDYRAALPFALHSIMSYITALTMAEPEFRSTMRSRETLQSFAQTLDGILRQMRAGFVRSQYAPSDFQYVANPEQIIFFDPSGSFGSVQRPHFQWQVGALDLCAHTDSYFNDLGSKLPYPSPIYKLGTVDFDWVPLFLEFAWVRDNVPSFAGQPATFHWEITNGQACAEAANRQSEEDFIVALQASGYFQLLQLQGTLLHLATDPDTSETVTGAVNRNRHLTNTTSVQIDGISNILCTPPEITAVGTRKEYECHSNVTLTLQKPDRVDPIPTRILLVALSQPSDVDYAIVLSEAELQPGTSSITLHDARTFDWYIAQAQSGFQLADESPSHVQLTQMAQQSTMAYTMPIFGTTQQETIWRTVSEGMVLLNDADEPPPEGQVRNLKVEPVTFSCSLTYTTTDAERSAAVKLVILPGTRNVRDIYVVVEETLGSGKKLRTYFDVGANPQLTYVPKSFFDEERRCLDRIAWLWDYISNRFAIPAPKVGPRPPGPSPSVPRTIETMVNQLAALRINAPELVAGAMRAFELSQVSTAHPEVKHKVVSASHPDAGHKVITASHPDAGQKGK